VDALSGLKVVQGRNYKKRIVSCVELAMR
jgi:hypothetical protein